jgi:hypothetical protein
LTNLPENCLGAIESFSLPFNRDELEIYEQAYSV